MRTIFQLVMVLVALLSTAQAVWAQSLPQSTRDQYYYQPCPAPSPNDALSQPADYQQNMQQAGSQQSEQEDMPAAPAVEKSRKLSRVFQAVAGRPYSVETRYGRVQINVWGRKEIRTEVEVITRADTDEKAQQLQDMIEVQVLENDLITGGISATSRFGLMPRECWSHQRLYEVNYTVWMPRNTPLRVANRFGEISINGNLTGATDLAIDYGTLRTGRLEGAQNLIRVGNGQGILPFARKASIDASYSTLRLDEGQAINLRNNYSNIDVGTVQDLTVHSKYGGVVLGTVHNLSGTSGYCKFSIDKLRNRLDMNVQYCPAFEVRNTGKNFQHIHLDGGYSTILLNFANNAGFNFDVNTDHGKLIVDKRLVRLDSEETSASSSDLQGQFGAVATKNSGNVNIKVHNGNVSFNK